MLVCSEESRCFFATENDWKLDCLITRKQYQRIADIPDVWWQDVDEVEVDVEDEAEMKLEEENDWGPLQDDMRLADYLLLALSHFPKQGLLLW